MIQLTSNELVHPDLIRRAVSGQDENGPTLALSLPDGSVRNLAGEDAISCWNELLARRVQFPFAVPSLPAPAAAAPSRKRKTAAAADATPPAPAESDATPPAPAEDAAPAAEQ